MVAGKLEFCQDHTYNHLCLPDCHQNMRGSQFINHDYLVNYFFAVNSNYPTAI
jgi:hypothetical protein